MFGGQLYIPTLPSGRQFTLNNVKKKEFQSKLLNLLEKEKASQKMTAMVKDFELNWTITADDETKIKLVA